MSEPNSIFDVKPYEVLEARLDAEAEAAYAASRILPHDKVVEWLKSWGTPDELTRQTRSDLTTIVWTEPARENLQAIRDYVKQFSPYAPAKVAAEIIETGDALVNFPHRGRMVHRTMREVITSYPYIIRYRIVGDEVVILRVRHQKDG